MPRIKQIHSVDEYPHELTNGEREKLDQVFPRYEGFMRAATTGSLYHAESDAPVLVTNSWSQMVHNPAFAVRMIDLCDVVLNELPWAQNIKMRELAIMTIYQRQRCDYGYRAHYNVALQNGITETQLAQLPLFRSSDLFDDEERTVIEFANAVLDGTVSDELFDRAKALYGEKAMLEFTAVVAYWAFWGMLINTLEPDYVPIPARH